MNVNAQMKNKVRRSLRAASNAIRRGDFAAKSHHLSEAQFWFNLLNEAGEEITEKEIFQRCPDTEDMFE